MSYRFHITHTWSPLIYHKPTCSIKKAKALEGWFVRVVLVYYMMPTWNIKGEEFISNHGFGSRAAILYSKLLADDHGQNQPDPVAYCLLISVTTLIRLLCNAFTSRIYRYLLCKRVVHPLYKVILVRLMQLLVPGTYTIINVNMWGGCEREGENEVRV